MDRYSQYLLHITRDEMKYCILKAFKTGQDITVSMSLMEEVDQIVELPSIKDTQD
jgi:hypothetical protein